MIPYKTFGELFSIGPYHVQTWGFMVAIGFLAGLFVSVWQAKRKKLDIDQVYYLSFAMLIGGILGARIGWILTEAPANLSFIDYFKVWNGGMILYGGMIGALLFFCIYAFYKKLSTWKYLDFFALGLPLGMAIGRVGCYLIGDHVGKPTLLPWAILMNGQLTHPVILYEIILLLGIFILMMCLKNKKLPDGRLFLLFLLSYSAGRFIIDFFRIDPTYHGLTIAQYASMAFIILSIILWRKT